MSDRPWPKLVIALICLLFSIGALLLLLTSEAKALAVASLLFFGLGGVGWWISESRYGPKPARVARVTLASGAEVDALVLPIKRATAVGVLLLWLGFGLGALVFGAAVPESSWLNAPDPFFISGPQWRTILLAIGIGSLALLPLYFVSLKRRSQDLLLAREGLQQGGVFVPWNEIAGLTRYEIERQQLLGLTMGDQVGSGSAAGVSGRIGLALTGFRRSVRLNGYGIPVDQVAWLIDDYWRNPDHRLRVMPTGLTGPSIDLAETRT